MLIRKVSFRRFCAGFAGTPWDHVFHFTGDAALAQLFLENAMDIRFLVLILDLVTAFFAANLARAEYGRLACLPAIGRVLPGKALIQNQVGGRCRTDVEVLVQPKSLPGARKIEAAFLPIATDARLIAPLGQHVAFAFSDVKVSTRAVAVALFVVARFKARDVGLHHTGAHDHESVSTAPSAALPLVERQLLDVGNKVGFPNSTAVKLRLGSKVVRLPGISVVEVVRIVEDKVLAGPLTQQLRQVGHRKPARAA